MCANNWGCDFDQNLSSIQFHTLGVVKFDFQMIWQRVLPEIHGVFEIKNQKQKLRLIITMIYGICDLVKEHRKSRRSHTKIILLHSLSAIFCSFHFQANSPHYGSKFVVLVMQICRISFNKSQNIKRKHEHQKKTHGSAGHWIN